MKGRSPIDVRNALELRSVPEPSSVLEVRSVAEFEQLIAEAPIPVVIDFWADWCSPCRRLLPELEKLASLHTGRVIVGKVNVDDLPELAERYDISGLPSLLRFDEGQTTAATAGLSRASVLAEELDLA